MSNLTLRSQTKDLDEQAKDSILGTGIPATKQTGKNAGSIFISLSDKTKVQHTPARGSCANKDPFETEEEEESPEDISDPETSANTNDQSKINSRLAEFDHVIRALDSSKPVNTKFLQSLNMANSLKIRDVIHMIPIFSGSKDDCSFQEFSAACLDARGMIPEEYEEDLTKIIKTRLKEGALQVVRNGQPRNINDLIKLLKGIYAPRQSSMGLYGDLSRLCQKPSEDVATYFNRARMIGNHIIEVYRFEHNDHIPPATKAEIENACCRAFVLGLKEEIYNLIKEHEDLSKAGPEAINIEEQLILQKSLRNLSLKDDAKCIFCEKVGHKARDCPLIGKDKKGAQQCQLCDREGHMAKDCRSRDKDSNDRFIQCQICKRTGHDAKNCRSNSNHLKCQICHRTGHEARQCRDSVNRNKEICQICRKIGHRADECRYYSPIHVAQASKLCQLCGLNNHESQNCRLKLPCPRCGQLGHFAKHCQFSTQCQICKGGNHTARSCPKINQHSIQCQYCLKNGHTAESCYQLKSHNSTRNQYCSFCKNTGHSIDSCTVRKTFKPTENQGNSRSLPQGEANISSINMIPEPNQGNQL